MENSTIDYTLVDARGLETTLGNIRAATNGLLQETKVVLPLATDIVWHGFGYLSERGGTGGVENLGGARFGVSHLTEVRQRGPPRDGMSSLLIEIKSQTEVVEGTLGELGAEQKRSVLDIGE